MGAHEKILLNGTTRFDGVIPEDVTSVAPQYVHVLY